MVRITTTRRVYVLGRRIHHGLTGCWLIGIGLALIAHDRRDWPWPFIDKQEIT